MKRFTIFLISASLLIFLLLKGQQDSSNDVPTKTFLDFSTASIPKNKINPGLVSTRQQVVEDLAKAIKKSGVSGDELDSLLSKYGPDEFLNHVGPELRPHYVKLNSVLDKLVPEQLEQDGMSPEFLGKYETYMPQSLQNIRAKLEEDSLPTNVNSLVESRLSSQELADDDIRLILEACGKGEKSCINKAFVTLIDANHSLTETQLSMIEGYL